MDNIVYINTDEMSCVSTDMSYEDIRKEQVEEDTSVIVSIVVQAYGRYDKTKECIDNIIKYSRGIEYKLILLDNGSETTDILELFKNVDYKNKIIMRISKNITGVFAMKKVFLSIKTRYCIVVNNDIIVTKNWLNNMITCAESDSSIGMICPVSTNISNNQLETLDGFDSIDEMQEKASKFNISNPDLWEERIRLIPTATLYRTAIFNDVGFYDMGFIHNFGDDDFSFRVRRAGYKLIVCRDTFVHHNHKVFEWENKDPEKEKKLTLTGQKIFQNKYNDIDAWNDTRNTIEFLFMNHELEFDIAKKISVLVVEPLCGTPVVDVKNFCKKKHIAIERIVAFTEDLKYYQDLNTVSDFVVCGEMQKLISTIERNSWDLIILNRPINTYASEIVDVFLKKCMYSKYIIFPLENMNSYIKLMNMFGVELEKEKKEQYRDISCETMVEMAKRYKPSNIDIIINNKKIADSVKLMIENIFQFVSQGEDCSELIDRLYVDKYWFVVEK